MSVSRGRFLALCGGGISGIWLASTGLLRLPTQMVFLSGSCSFCGEEPRFCRERYLQYLMTGKPVTRAIAGVIGRETRICNGCIEFCFDILADEAALRHLPPPPVDVDVSVDIMLDPDLTTRLGCCLALPGKSRTSHSRRFKLSLT